MHIERILRDSELFELVKRKLNSFFVSCVLPRVLCGPAAGASTDKENIPSNQQELICFCRREAFGKMIGCDNPQCKYEWFHLECVNVTTIPKGKWYCSKCKT